jgi:hypothetical protein
VYASARRLQEILVEHGTVTVEAVSVSEAGVVLSMSRGFRLTVIPDVVADGEDWRFFAPGVDAAHLVIAGGKIAPESFD